MNRTLKINPHSKPLPHSLSQEDFESALDELVEGAISIIEDQRGHARDPEAMGAEYYLLNLPTLTSRRRVQLYLAAVARGMQLGLLTGEQSKRCMYVAQLALAAFGGSNADPEPRKAVGR